MIACNKAELLQWSLGKCSHVITAETESPFLGEAKRGRQKCNMHRGEEEGGGLQLAMGEAWTSRMQLVTDSRERMARLLNAANTREGLNTPRSAGQVSVHAPAVSGSVRVPIMVAQLP